MQRKSTRPNLENLLSWHNYLHRPTPALGCCSCLRCEIRKTGALCTTTLIAFEDVDLTVLFRQILNEE